MVLGRQRAPKQVLYLTQSTGFKQFKNSRRDRHVLLSLSLSSVDLTTKGVKRTDGDFANAWYASWGSSPVFYTALGPRPEVWQDSAYQQHFAGGITWAIGG